MKPLLLPLLLSLSCCVIGGDQYQRPRDLTPDSLVDRTRVLAIQATPPEAAPGETVHFSALLPDPSGELETTLWLACSPEQSTGMGCALNFTNLDFKTATPDELMAAGLIGIEPLWAPSLAIPPTALDGLSDQDAMNGVYWQVQLLALPADITGDLTTIDFNSVESANKRLVVSASDSPNANPTLERFSVDGLALRPDDVVLLDAGQAYEVEVVIPDEDIQGYSYLSPSGITEQRVEQPYVRWYANHGRFTGSTSLHPFLYTTWRAPEQRGVEGSFWAVVRDRRGGIGWIEQPYSIR